MPKSGVLLVLFLVVTVLVALDRVGGAPPPGARSDGGSMASAEAAVEPIAEFGDHGWLQRTLTVRSDSPGLGPVEVVVEMRVRWAAGTGHVRVVGRDTEGRYDEVMTDEVRVGADLTASLGHYQRMYDELRATGGSVFVEAGVTVARQVVATPDGAADDVWRIGEGDPEW